MDALFLFLKKALVGILTFVFAFVIVYVPQPHTPKAQALPAFEINPIVVGGAAATSVATVAQTTKDSILDGIAFYIINAFLQQMLQSLVVWINSGFKGSPMFIQDFDRFLLNVADEAAGEFIKNELGEVGSFICEPFRLDIQMALALKYQKARERRRDSCTVSGIVDNVERFLNNEVRGKNFWKRAPMAPLEKKVG